jgi:hypothetical protein
LDKILDTSWQQLRVGAGGEEQAVKAGTLHMVTVTDAGRQWLVPAYEGKGAVPGNADVGDESRVGLRLLFNRGFQPDSTGRLYPLGSAGAVNFAGAKVGQYAWQWAGDQGLYQVWHKPWLDFRARAVQHVYHCQLRVGDLLTLDPSQADLVDYHLCFWEKVSLSVAAGSARPRLGIRSCYEHDHAGRPGPNLCPKRAQDWRGLAQITLSSTSAPTSSACALG